MNPRRFQGLAAAALLLALPSHAWARALGPIQFKPHPVKTADGGSVAAQWGTVRLPENRSRPGGASVELAMLRFKSTSRRPGPPIFFLPGGPGNAAIPSANGPRLPLFLAMRQFGDVILLDQRGVGDSKPRLDCDEKVEFPGDRRVDRAAYINTYIAAARSCAARWRRRGVDLGSYTSDVSADDIDDVREALGAKKMVLWALSYGNTLAIETIKRHPDRVARAIMAGVEGQDHTAKLPSTYRAHLRQLDQLVRGVPELAREIPNLETMTETVVRRLNENPQRIMVTYKDTGKTEPFTLDGTLLGWTLNDLWGSDGAGYIPLFILEAYKGNYDDIASLIGLSGAGLESAMHGAMDCASGVSPERQRQVDLQAGDTLFADINFPYMEVCAGWGVKPIGPSFWAPARSSIPVLFISGTLDAKTPPFQAEEIRRGFPNSSHLIIDGAVHSNPLFLSNPRIKDIMIDFLAGRPVRDMRLMAEPLVIATSSPFRGK